LLAFARLSPLSQRFCVSAAWKNPNDSKKTARQVLRGGWLGALRMVSGGPRAVSFHMGKLALDHIRILGIFPDKLGK
jgi:hypothetical protein